MKSAVPCLYTAGYEGCTIEAFIAVLRQLNIQVLVDVRELPLSRKKGFSKSALSAALARQDIEYRHLPALGCPRPIRDRYKQDGDWQAYTLDFKRHLRQQGAALKALAELGLERPLALMCFEADVNRCHRSFVGRAVCAKTAQKLAHIRGQTVSLESELRAAA